MGTQTTGRRSRKRKAISSEEAAIGRRLKEIRLRRRKTQAQVAAAVGITQPALSECESGEVRLHGALLASLARTLRVSADQLLGLKGSETTPPRQSRLLNRLQRIEELSASNRRSVLSILDALIDKQGRNGSR
jgi:transcriptional regulator with XRE-family HTH domain